MNDAEFKAFLLNGGQGPVDGTGVVVVTNGVPAAPGAIDLGNVALATYATPLTGANWATAAPTTDRAAIERIAAAVAGLLTTPIP